MYSFVAGTIKPASSYDWFQYRGSNPVTVYFRGIPIKIAQGQRFGVRPSGNSKHIRLVLVDDVNRVITITVKQARQLASNVVRRG